MKFRKKPVVIEAMRWTGEDNAEGIQAAVAFCQPLPHAPDDAHIHAGLGYTPATGELFIPTLEGTMTASPGDWIIKGVKGEFYPCKPDIFEATYEPA
jgi:hypothetical protein